jgi:hypothetical protein
MTPVPYGWFGKDWGARICRKTPHQPTPVGEPCPGCDDPIAEGEHGVLIPYRTLDGSRLQLQFHLKCYVVSAQGCHIFRRKRRAKSHARRS